MMPCCKCGNHSNAGELKPCRRADWPPPPDPPKWEEFLPDTNGDILHRYRTAVRKEKETRMEQLDEYRKGHPDHRACAKCRKTEYGCRCCGEWECSGCAADQDTPRRFEEHHEVVDSDVDEDCYGRRNASPYKRLQLRACISCNYKACVDHYKLCDNDECNVVLCEACEGLQGLAFRHTWCAGCAGTIENNDDFDIGPVDREEGVCFKCWRSKDHYCGCGHPSYDDEALEKEEKEDDAGPSSKRAKTEDDDPDTDNDSEVDDDGAYEMVLSTETFTPQKPPARPSAHRPQAPKYTSYRRFQYLKQSPQYISCRERQSEQSKKVQVNTVLGHLLDCLVEGEPLDLNRLADFCPAPTKGEWQQLEAAENSKVGLDVRDRSFRLPILLRLMLGNAMFDNPAKEPSSTIDWAEMEAYLKFAREREKKDKWYRLARWYQAFSRLDYTPEFQCVGEDGDDVDDKSTISGSDSDEEEEEHEL